MNAESNIIPIRPELVPGTADASQYVRDVHARIESLENTTADDRLALGKFLIDAKAKLGHGNFIAWVTGPCGLNERTARRYMDGVPKSDTPCPISPEQEVRGKAAHRLNAVMAAASIVQTRATASTPDDYQYISKPRPAGAPKWTEDEPKIRNYPGAERKSRGRKPWNDEWCKRLEILIGQLIEHLDVADSTIEKRLLTEQFQRAVCAMSCLSSRISDISSIRKPKGND